MLQLPTFLMGSRDQVRKLTRQFLNSIAAGKPPEVTLMDAAAGGVIRVDECLSSPEGDRSFHMYMPILIASKSRNEQLGLKLADTLLQVPWGPLAMMGQDAGLMRGRAIPEDRWTEFLAAILQWWPDYAAEPLRYNRGLNDSRLWDLNTTFMHGLSRRGIPKDELMQPLPDDNLEALMRRHEDKFSDVLQLAQERRKARGG
jgi:hypothetical protein